MNSFANDFKTVWSGPNNGLYRIIIINAAVWITVNLVNLFVPQAPTTLLGEYLKIPTGIVEFLLQPWSIITSFFTHESFWHIFWNMIILYWFGEIAMGLIGNRKVISMYILGGLAGGVAYLLAFNLIAIPFLGASPLAGALGASAAVNAVILGAATLTPEYRMHLLLIGPVKLKYIAAVVVILSVFGLRGGNAGGEVAHLGGALMGFIYVTELRKGNDLGRWILNILDWVERLFEKKNKSKVHVSYRSNQGSNARKATGAGVPDQSVVDAILDKISDSGYDKLTAEEKQILFKASQNSKH